MIDRANVLWWVVGVAFGVALIPLGMGFSPVGRWLSSSLVLSDPPRRADAIVVLGAGAYDPITLTPDSAYRLLHGLQLFRDGYAPLLILVGSSHRGVTATDADAMAMVARTLGVVPTALVLDPTPSTTHGAAESVARLARSRGITSILLTTSPLESRRAAHTFRRAGLDVISAPGPSAPPLSVAQDHPAGRMALVIKALYEHLAIAVYAWRGWI